MEQDPVVLSVVRTGSALASVAVEYYIEPNGGAKFYGGSGVIYFSPGEAVRRVTVIAKDDGVPQVTTHTLTRTRSHTKTDLSAIFAGETGLVRLSTFPYTSFASSSF